MRYERALSKPFEELLAVGGVLRPLVEYCRKPWRNPKVVPDLQLREKNKIGIYLGLTRVLELQMKGDALEPTASNTYKLSDRHGIKGLYGPEKYARLCEELLHYLDAVDVDESRYLESEGWGQNWLSARYGLERRPDQGELLAVDREVVIGYKNEGEKEMRWGNQIQRPFLELAAGLSKMNPKLYGKEPRKRVLGNELDLLAWEPPNTFLCVEAKRSKNTHGIYMGPLQVAAYTVAWREAASSGVLDGVLALVRQKRDLDLLSMSDDEFDCFKKGITSPQFVPAIVVQDPKRRSHCWKRIQEVVTYAHDHWPKELGDNPLEALRIYSIDWAENRLRNITDECKGW